MLARQGIVAGSYDDCSLPEVAAMIGANDPDAESSDGTGRSQQVGFDQFMTRPLG